MNTTMWNRFTGVLGLLALGFGLVSAFVFHSFGDMYTSFHLAIGAMLLVYWFITVGTRRASETKQIVQGRTVRFGGPELLLKGIVEIVENLVHLFLGRGDVVEFSLHVRREFQIEDLGEVLDQELGHDHAEIGGVESPLLLLDV